MSDVYYKTSQLDLIVLVSFNYLNNDGRLNLKKIRLFKNIDDVIQLYRRKSIKFNQESKF